MLFEENAANKLYSTQRMTKVSFYFKLYKKVNGSTIEVYYCSCTLENFPEKSLFKKKEIQITLLLNP